MEILNTILPVFSIIAIGYALRWFGYFTKPFAEGLNSMAYWVGLPALLFYRTAIAEYDLGSAWSIYLLVIFGMCFTTLAGLLASRLFRMPADRSALMVQGAFRGNLVYIGLPIIVYSLAGDEVASAESLAVIVIALTVPIYNMLAVVVLLLGRHKLDRSALPRVLKGVLTNPLLIASVLGIIYNFTFDSLNPIALRTLSAVAQMALPLALFSIGATLFDERIAGNILPTTIGSVIKTFLSPAAGLMLAAFLGIGGIELRIALILLACPTAVASHVMAEQIIGKQPLSASIVLLSTLFSIVAFAVVLALF